MKSLHDTLAAMAKDRESVAMAALHAHFSKVYFSAIAKSRAYNNAAKMVAEYEESCAFRPRPPTLEELRAHHEAQADAHGVSRWLFSEGRDGWRVYCYDGPASVPPGPPPRFSRPLDPDGGPCVWPSSGDQT